MVLSVDEMLDYLPPYNEHSQVIVRHQDVGDIMQEVVAAHRYFASDYDVLADFFWTGNVYETCKLLWDFCKNEVRYVVEPKKNQTTKSPAAILELAYGDCKHYAGFIGGVLDAINREFNEGIQWKYCFASYDKKEKLPQHVFVVVFDHTDDIWIDPVLNAFDERLQPAHSYYKTVNMLSRVSGINNSLYNVRYPGSVGVVPWAEVAQGALSIVTNIFGGDKVPNYPVKETSTFDSLKKSLREDWVGTVAPGGNFEIVPSSIAEAQSMLAKAKKRKQEEIALGHGYGDGPGWDTLQMLYDETIKALELFIQAAGNIQAGVPVTPGDLTAGASTKSWLPLALGAGAILLLMNRGKRRSVSGISNKTLLIGGGAIALLLLMKKKKSEPVTTEIPSTQTPGILGDQFTQEAIEAQKTSPVDLTKYGADVVNEYNPRPVKVSDPYDLINETQYLYASQFN